MEMGYKRSGDYFNLFIQAGINSISLTMKF